MKIEAVKMMRNIRDKMSLDLKGMTYEEEQEYLSNQIKTFKYLTEIMPNKKLKATPYRASNSVVD